ncbi:pectinesterase inhibitor 12-like [Aegilops tauschii subsp. strangulata]|nr:pectinesterase inhibitor 12-like [Aegilops tauschii subsp. strangulata]
MRQSQALSLLVLLLLLASSSASILEDACRSFGNPDTYNICIKFFKADKESALANKRGLAVIATGIAKKTAAVTLKRIAALKAKDKDPKIQAILFLCDHFYSMAVGLFDEAAIFIWSNKVGDAVTSLGSAWNVPRSCEDEFRKAGVKSPLHAENSKFEMECIITVGVTERLRVVS